MALKCPNCSNDKLKLLYVVMSRHEIEGYRCLICGHLFYVEVKS